MQQPSFTQIPNELLDEWMPILSGTELRVLFVIARQTFGWVEDSKTGRRKEKDWIAKSQLKQKTGAGNVALTKATSSLFNKGLIDIMSTSGEVLDTPEKRSGKRLVYSIKLETSSQNDGGLDTTSSESEPQPVQKVNTTKETNTKESISKDIPSQNMISSECGDTPVKRILHMYNRFWKDIYGKDYRVDSWAKVGAMTKRWLANYSEIQIAAMICVHFNWYGADGKNEWQHKRLENEMFPISWIGSKLNEYEIYLRNKERVKFDDPVEVRKYISRHLPRK